jgi:vacuolar-type H+-ATPase subunit I/STV1
MSDPVTPAESGAPEAQSGEPEQKPQGSDQTQAILRQLRKAKKELEAYKSAEQQRSDSELSETERLKKALSEKDVELKTIRDSARMERLQSRFEAAAAKAGAVDPDAVARLSDLSSVDLDAEDGGKAEIDALIAAQKTQRAYLFGAPPAPTVGGNGGNPASGNPATKTVTAEDVSKMSAEQFQKWLSDRQSRR